MMAVLKKSGQPVVVASYEELMRELGSEAYVNLVCRRRM